MRRGSVMLVSRWLEESAEEPGTKTLFGRRLTERGLKHGRPGGQKGRVGVRLNDEGEAALTRLDGLTGSGGDPGVPAQ